MTTMTRSKPAALEPPAVKLNAEGKAVGNFDSIEVPLPQELGATVSIRVMDDQPGFRAEALLSRAHVAAQSGTCRERAHAVLDAIEGLTNRLVDASDRARGSLRKWLTTAVDAITAWGEAFEKQARKEQAVISKTRALTVVDATCEPTEHDSEERRQILKEFRQAWSAFDRSWRDLGEKALRVRDAYAWRAEGHLTFEDWIVAEKRPTSIIYQAIHAVRMERLAMPVAERLKVVLDRESHFRAIPARINGEEITADEVKDIVKQLAKTVEADADGLKHAKASDVKAAVRAINETQDYSDEQVRKDRLQAKWDEEDRKRQTAAIRPDVPDSIEAEIAAAEPAPVITGEYCEVQPEADSLWAEDLRLFKREVADRFVSLFQKHGHDKAFLKAATKVFHNWSEEVAARQPTRRAK
jgi:hypothetical protein